MHIKYHFPRLGWCKKVLTIIAVAVSLILLVYFCAFIAMRYMNQRILAKAEKAFVQLNQYYEEKKWAEQYEYFSKSAKIKLQTAIAEPLFSYFTPQFIDDNLKSVSEEKTYTGYMSDNWITIKSPTGGFDPIKFRNGYLDVYLEELFKPHKIINKWSCGKYVFLSVKYEDEAELTIVMISEKGKYKFEGTTNQDDHFFYVATDTGKRKLVKKINEGILTVDLIRAWNDGYSVIIKAAIVNNTDKDIQYFSGKLMLKNRQGKVAYSETFTSFVQAKGHSIYNWSIDGFDQFNLAGIQIPLGSDAESVVKSVLKFEPEIIEFSDGTILEKSK